LGFFFGTTWILENKITLLGT